MLLNSQNLKNLKYKTKRVKLEKAEAEIIIALLPVSLIQDARKIKDLGDDNPEAESFGFKIINSAIVDEKGDAVFATKESFESLPLAVQSEIQEAIWDYNGLSSKAQDKAEKN